ncbi:MAG: hypothetical protein GEV11_28870 [Streptosporangiales bacterium]|nr:hypothetical protein [Streptosporangiales bacterium]
MKYMIMMYGTQRDYAAMSGEETGTGWTAEDFTAMYEFMAQWNQELVDSGEFVDARGLGAPVLTRRVTGLKDGVPVVTDGPYAETAEVLAGYTIVECASFDRATEIAARVTQCPSPPGAEVNAAYVDVRPILEDRAADLQG